MQSAIERLTYHPLVGKLIRSVGMRPVARQIYWAMAGNARIRTVRVGDISAVFRTTSALEYRTVQGTATGEEDLMGYLLSQIRPTDAFLDVGANLGFFTVFAAKKCASVLSCEPEPIAYERLQANVKLNNLANVQCLNIALSDYEGNAFLSQQASDKAIQDAHLAEAGTPVRVRRGDHLPLTATVVKVDVEGHEIAVINGMGSALSRARLVICEVHSNLGVNVSDVERALDDKSGPWSFRSYRRHEQIHLIASRH